MHKFLFMYYMYMCVCVFLFYIILHGSKKKKKICLKSFLISQLDLCWHYGTSVIDVLDMFRLILESH